MYEEDNNENGMKCPSCGSHCVVPVTKKAAFGVGKSIIGAAILGPAGLAAGLLGGREKTRVMCMHCGKIWNPDSIWYQNY